MIPSNGGGKGTCTNTHTPMGHTYETFLLKKPSTTTIFSEKLSIKEKIRSKAPHISIGSLIDSKLQFLEGIHYQSLRSLDITNDIDFLDISFTQSSALGFL